MTWNASFGTPVLAGRERSFSSKPCDPRLKNHHEWLLKEQADAPKGQILQISAVT